jgi:hypothetical protein
MLWSPSPTTHRVAMLLGEKAHQHVLGVVGVLVLVDQHVLEAVLVSRQDIGMNSEQIDGEHQEVVEIHRRSFDQALLIEPVYVGDLLVIEACVRGGVSLVVD